MSSNVQVIYPHSRRLSAMAQAPENSFYIPNRALPAAACKVEAAWLDRMERSAGAAGLRKVFC